MNKSKFMFEFRKDGTKEEIASLLINQHMYAVDYKGKVWDIPEHEYAPKVKAIRIDDQGDRAQPDIVTHNEAWEAVGYVQFSVTEMTGEDNGRLDTIKTYMSQLQVENDKMADLIKGWKQ